MKKILSFLLLTFVGMSLVIAQPQKMTWQGVVRNANDELIVNQQVGVQASIREDTPNGLVVYRETHVASTNANGLLSIIVGDGVNVFPLTLADIQWGEHDYYLQVEIDPAGGINYTITGTQQLITVPYAFYASSVRYADTALYLKNFSDTAKYAIHSDTANYAYNAGNANYANNAGIANSATYADSTRVSNYAYNAGTANNAIYSDSSRVSNFAYVADFNNLLNRPAGTNMGDILYWDTASTSWRILPVGNIGEVLTLDSNYVPHWNTGNSQVSLPTVQSDSVFNIAATSANAAGTVTNDGGGMFVFSGICWSTSPNPTIADNHTFDGMGLGAFTANLSGLAMGVTYHVRAFATNSAGTAYGNDLSFTTSAYPTVVTSAVSSITTTMASSGGNVTFDGNDPVTELGVCWSTSQFPTIADNHTVDGNGTGVFVSSVTGLTANTTYYLRAYATNGVGTAYGDTVSFKTVGLAPTVITTAASNIKGSTATTGGNVTSDGGVPVTERGVCWSTSPNPTMADSVIQGGSGTGSFTANMTNLTGVTTYHVRAYAINAIDTAYGADESFTTQQLPTVVTEPITDITTTGANSGVTVLSDGGFTVTFCGICWSTSPNPTISDSKTIDGAGVGTFSSILYDLSDTTTYYVRAYASNSMGTGYGQQLTFTTFSFKTCPGVPTVTDYEGNVYKTIQIGAQCWMRENLRSEYYADGTPIALGSLTSSSIAFRYYPDSGGVALGGYLYNLPAVMKGASYSNNVPSGVQGVCPNGWHVPSANEWRLLQYYVAMQPSCSCGSSVSLAKALASPQGWRDYTQSCTPGKKNDYASNNTTGFALYPAGYSTEGYKSDQGGNEARYWSCSDYVDPNNPNNIRYWYFYTYYSDYQTNVSYWDNYVGMPVRCVKDGYSINTSNDAKPCQSATTVTDVDNNVYNTVQIGNQCWMKENLRTTKYPDGTSIPNGTGSSTSTTAAYFYHANNSSSNDYTYGLLYTWTAAMDSSTTSGTQGICPNGWHIPTAGDFYALNSYVAAMYGCNGYSAKALASQNYWQSYTYNGQCPPGYNYSTNNASGFSAEPAGRFYGSYNGFNNYSYIWSSSYYYNTGQTYPYPMFNYVSYSEVNSNFSYTSALYFGYSVRCIKD